jgi:SAM-dependent methyltransferase
MRDDYVDTFDTRGDLYNEACKLDPGARAEERRVLIDLLEVQAHHRVCDAPAGGGYLAEGLRPLLHFPSQVVCIEPSTAFSAGIPEGFTFHLAPLKRLPLHDAGVDRVASLAGLHHLADKREFMREAHRVLVPGGRFVVGDVLADTPVAAFLNGPVDRYSETGHRGMFLRAHECEELLAEAGFDEIREVHHELSWCFDSEAAMVGYCRALFGLVHASEDQVLAALTDGFDLRREAEAVRLPWSLVYGVGVKAA